MNEPSAQYSSVYQLPIHVKFRQFFNITSSKVLLVVNLHIKFEVSSFSHLITESRQCQRGSRLKDGSEIKGQNSSGSGGVTARS